jgi:hypothetical protein
MDSFEAFKNQIKKSQVNYTSPWYSRTIIRKFSPFITKFLVTKTNVSANQITILQLISSLIGMALLCFSNVYFALVGVLFLHVGYVFDCIDGEVARYRKSQSINGMFLDFVNHEIIIPMTFGCLSFHYFFQNQSTVFFGVGLALILLRINPIGKARQTTINYLIQKHMSPAYSISKYKNGSDAVQGKGETNNSEKDTTRTTFGKIKKNVEKFVEYPNDVIIITFILMIDILTSTMVAGKIVIPLLLCYYIMKFILDLWWHMKSRIPERDFGIQIKSAIDIAKTNPNLFTKK